MRKPLNDRWLIPILNPLASGHGVAMALARRLIAAAGADPVVPYAIGDFTLRIPLSHQLPRIRSRYPTYGINQATLTSYLIQKYPDLSAIDVGANIGDTVALWRAVGDFPVLAIEPSKLYLRLLRLNAQALGHVTVQDALIGESDGDARLRIQERRGTARVIPGEQTRRVTRLTSLVAMHPAFHRAKLVKIDTDGSDGQVILGGREWIAEAKPTIFFEFAPLATLGGRRPLLEAVELLLSLGYCSLMFYDNVGEFALTVQASERERIEELYAHALAWGDERYWDVAAFHRDDEDVAIALRSHELRSSRA
jgi:FkbM family methyltransferase